MKRGRAGRTFDGEEDGPGASGVETQLLAPPPASPVLAETDGAPGLLEQRRVREPVADAVQDEVRERPSLDGHAVAFVRFEAPLDVRSVPGRVSVRCVEEERWRC